jgi:hypothetical protein
VEEDDGSLLQTDDDIISPSGQPTLGDAPLTNLRLGTGGGQTGWAKLKSKLKGGGSQYSQI